MCFPAQRCLAQLYIILIMGALGYDMVRVGVRVYPQVTGPKAYVHASTSESQGAEPFTEARRLDTCLSSCLKGGIDGNAEIFQKLENGGAQPSRGPRQKKTTRPAGSLGGW